MSVANPSSPDAGVELLRAYNEFEKNFRVRQAITGCFLVLICMPLGTMLDWFVYPEHLLKFLFFGRLLCDIPVLVLLLILLRPLGRQQVQIIDKIWPALPAISIAWMIYMTEGSRSPYYAGLNLVLIVACLLMPYSFWEAISICLATLGAYFVACVAHWQFSDIPIATSTLFNNAYFIVITAVICAISCHYNRNRRIQEFSLRRQLDQRNKELAQLDQLKSQFFANVSHELRTPLTLILAPATELLNEPERLSEPVLRALQNVRQNGLRLLKLITDLLEIVRLDERKSTLDMQNVDLTAFTRGTVESVRYLAEQKSLQIQYTGKDERLSIRADPTRLERVLLNLLSNAIKFTLPGGRITVDLHAEDGEAVFAVADTGMGIPAKDLPYIFDRFRQADGSSTRRFQGMGLGLALVRELVQEHGGTLNVSSQENKGTVFTVRLPRNSDNLSRQTTTMPYSLESPPDPIAQLYHDADRTLLNPHAPLDWDELSSVQGEGDRCVLVIEDEPDLRRFVVSLLARNYQVRQAGDGRRGLEAVAAYHPDLVVLDLMLPELDGLEVCRRIKSDPATAQTRVLLLTARADDESRLTALRNGADDFLCKPFSSEELTTRIANLLHSAKLEREVLRQNSELASAMDKLKATEAQLVQSEKMNAVGQLSAGILHEINNPLNAAMMAVKVGERKNQDARVAECLGDIGAAMQRIRTITNDLRSFAHPHQDALGDIFTIESAVTSAQRLLSHEFSGRDVLEVKLIEARVQGNKNQVVHVLINILTNALQAVRITAERRKPKITLATQIVAGRLSVNIEDNGPGIAEKHLNRVTEPFYTTREVGQGMGLGLSICHTIVKNHGGNLVLESEPDYWTRVTFDLPLCIT